jgi:dTDP-6-deoxy-L-talose 4-dehydrogenase (NAD+)
MKILLTGPTGFIGGNLLRRLLQGGHQVAALVHPYECLSVPLRSHPAVLELVGTLETVPWPAVDAFRPHACVHTAWITTPGLYWESPDNDRFVDWSVDFAKRFFQSGGRHFLGLGTCAEYAPGPGPFHEEGSPVGSATRYARAKNALRIALEDLAREQGTRVTWARVFYPYGPGELPARFCSSLLHQLDRGEVVELKTPNSVKDYIYIDDLAEALHTLLVAECAGIVNLGTGIGTTVRDLALALATAIGRSDRIREAAVPGLDPLDHVVADASRLGALGWAPEVTVADGARRLAQHLLPHRFER